MEPSLGARTASSAETMCAAATACGRWPSCSQPRPLSARSIVVCTAGLLLCVCASADYAPLGELRDLMLIYAGKGDWKTEDFRPYVAHLAGPDGNQPRDWFYDSFLFMQYGDAPSGALYIDGKTDKADWEAFRRLIFDPASHLHALDRAVDEAAKVLGPPPRRIPIVVMIPYPHPAEADFGDVDGDGKSENLREEGDLGKVIRWHLDAVIDEFAKAKFAHLKLCGFYWMIEWLSGERSESAVRDAAVAVHERGLKFVWIPCWGAGDAERSAELGFDLSYLQPNYAFMYQAHLEADPQRLCEAAERAAGHGLGIEIELDPATPQDPRFRQNLIDYLSHGADTRDGYMRRAPHAYYQSSYIIKELHNSPLPANRRLYDALYQFARGTYAGGVDRSLAAGRACRFATPPKDAPAKDAQRCLTDGRERELLTGEVGAVTWAGKASVELDLGGLRPVGGVWAHWQVPQPGPPAPTWIAASSSASAEGDDWADVPALAPAQVEPPPSDARFSTGAIAVRLERREARRVRVEVWGEPGAGVTLDEVQVLPATPLAVNQQCIVRPAPDQPALDAGDLLTDGLYADPVHTDRTATWKRGPVEINLDLGLRAYLSGVAIHLPGEGKEPPRWVEVRTGAQEGEWAEGATWRSTGKDRGEWLRVGFPPRDAQRIALRVEPGDRPFGCDEIEMTTPVNLGLRRPYRVAPPWTSKYPDDGKKLTDGVRMAHDFSEGKAVGWSLADPTITIDLGQEHPVDSVNVGAEGGGLGWVFLPTQVTVLVSTDGSTFRLAGELKPEGRESGNEALVEALRVPTGGVRARTVRVCVRRHGWAMLDEIEVMSGGRNVAAGRPYFVTPPPDPQEKYADTTGGVLTDGEWGGLAWGEGKTVGWEGVKPVIELDLGRAVTVRKVRAYVLGGGPGAVWFPDMISLSTSKEPVRDGWIAAGSTTEHPAESGDQGVGAFMDVTLGGSACQHMRVEIEPHGWVMLGEIEVYGE